MLYITELMPKQKKERKHTICVCMHASMYIEWHENKKNWHNEGDYWGWEREEGEDMKNETIARRSIWEDLERGGRRGKLGNWILISKIKNLNSQSALEQ